MESGFSSVPAKGSEVLPPIFASQQMSSSREITIFAEDRPNIINMQGNTGADAGIHNGDNNIIINQQKDALEDVAKAAHNSISSRRVEGTGDWLLKTIEFSQCIKTKSHAFLWLHGAAGSGKSMLMSRVIEHIRKDYDVKDSRLLYFYVHYEKKEQKPYHTMIQTFLQQAQINSNHNNSYERASGTDEEDLSKALYGDRKDVYIIIDAVDQLPKEDMSSLLTYLNSLARKYQGENNTRRLAVIISSRDCDGCDQIQSNTVLKIHVKHTNNSDDIKRYLNVALRSDLLSKKPELKKEAETSIADKSNGMFLWAKLQTQTICAMKLEQDVKSALDSHIKPTQMDHVYNTYAVAFEELYGIEKEVAQRTMALLALTTGSISKNVLLEALEVETCMGKEKKRSAAEEDFRKNLHMIAQICKYLVELDLKQGVFRFCHSSAFEFFRSYQPKRTYKLITRICLAYLSSSDFREGYHLGAKWYDYGRLGPLIENHPFLMFASCNWANSLRETYPRNHSESSDESDEEMLTYLNEFFGESGERKNPQLAFQVYTLSLRNGIAGQTSHEHIISYLGLVNLLDLFAKREWFDLQTVDNNGWSAIHWAICRATEPEMKADVPVGEVCAVVAKLIDYGVNINTPDKNGRTALHCAAQHGHVEVVKLLVNKEAKLNTKDQQNQTALIDACRTHHEETISILVKAGADLWVQSSRGTALQALCQVGCCKCVKLILDQDQVKNPLGKYYSLAARSTLAKSLLSRHYMRQIGEEKGAFGTPLHVAAFHGHQEIVELLLEQGKFKVHATHHTYESVLTAADARYNTAMNIEPYEGIFELPVAHGVNVNNKKGARGPTLLAAALNGQKGLVELLLNNGAKVKSALGIKGTGSQATSDIGCEKLIELIENGGADIAAAFGRSSLENPSYGLFNVHQEFLKHTLTATNKRNISSLMRTGETLIYKEIEKGEITKKLSMMLTLGNEVFEETAELATNTESNTKQRKIKKRVKVAGKLVGWASRFRDQLSRQDDVQTMMEGVDFAGLLGLTIQSAINILGKAIEVRSPVVKNHIAYCWVDVLHNIMTGSDDGEALVRRLMNDRASEYNGYWTDTTLNKNERLDKVMALSRVSYELLLVTFRYKEKFRGLSLILSSLCSSAVNDVVGLEDQGSNALRKFLEIVVDVVSEALESKDPREVHACADAGVELLKQTALDPRRSLIEPCADEWVRQWNRMIEGGMSDVIVDIIDHRIEEFRAALEDKKYDEVLGIDIAALALLRAAIEQEFTEVIDTVLLAVVMGFCITMETLTDYSALNELWEEDQVARRVLGEESSPERRHIYESVIDSFFSLISMAQRKRFTQLETLVLVIGNTVQTMPNQVRQKVDEVIIRHIKAAETGTDLQRMEVNLTVHHVLAVARNTDRAGTQQFCSWVEGLATECKWKWREIE